MKRKDQIEDFIRENREAFEGPGPGAQVWDSVDQSLDKRGKAKIIPFMRRHAWKAAAVILILIAMTIRVISREDSNNLQRGNASDLTDMQHYYNQQIALKMSLIQPASSGNATVSPESLYKQQQQDPAFQNLQEAFRENPGDASVKAALYQYYQARLNMLDRISSTIRESTHPNTNMRYEKNL